MTNNLALRDPLREFIAAARLTDVVPIANLEAGLADLELELERLAGDALAAERRGVPLSQAAADFTNYPQLARLHAVFDSILTLSLPPEIVVWVRSFLAMREAPALDRMLVSLVDAASNAQSPHLRALARFALFEGVRLNLVVLARWYPSETFGVGMELADLDRIAEHRVDSWLSSGPAAPHGVRPFHLVAVAAIESLNSHADELRREMATLQREFVEQLRMRGRIEGLLGAMNAPDAILMRNELASSLDEQQVTVEMLQSKHPLLLGGVTRNALDQRARRARSKPEQLVRKRPALIDLLRERDAGGER